MVCLQNLCLNSGCGKGKCESPWNFAVGLQADKRHSVSNPNWYLSGFLPSSPSLALSDSYDVFVVPILDIPSLPWIHQTWGPKLFGMLMWAAWRVRAKSSVMQRQLWNWRSVWGNPWRNPPKSWIVRMKTTESLVDKSRKHVWRRRRKRRQKHLLRCLLSQACTTSGNVVFFVFECWNSCFCALIFKVSILSAWCNGLRHFLYIPTTMG